jgi:hypothetical protein
VRDWAASPRTWEGLREGYNLAQPDRDRLQILCKDDFERLYDPGGLLTMLVVSRQAIAPPRDSNNVQSVFS